MAVQGVLYLTCEKMKKFKISTDKNLNPELKKDVQSLRGMIFSNMPNVENDRFQMSSCIDRPAVIILDTVTGKITNPISLCNLRGAIQVLNDLGF